MSSSDNVKPLPRPWHGKEGPATLDAALSYVRVSDALWDSTTGQCGARDANSGEAAQLEKLSMVVSLDELLYVVARQDNKNIVWWLHHMLEAAADGSISRLVYAARQVVQKLNNEAYATRHRKRKSVIVTPPTRKARK